MSGGTSYDYPDPGGTRYQQSLIYKHFNEFMILKV